MNGIICAKEKCVAGMHAVAFIRGDVQMRNCTLYRLPNSLLNTQFHRKASAFCLKVFCENINFDKILYERQMESTVVRAGIESIDRQRMRNDDESSFSVGDVSGSGGGSRSGDAMNQLHKLFYYRSKCWQRWCTKYITVRTFTEPCIIFSYNILHANQKDTRRKDMCRHGRRNSSYACVNALHTRVDSMEKQPRRG